MQQLAFDLAGDFVSMFLCLNRQLCDLSVYFQDLSSIKNILIEQPQQAPGFRTKRLALQGIFQPS